jgi:diamine N-acetyltransferase
MERRDRKHVEFSQVTLRYLDESNWLACVTLRVKKEQRDLICSNDRSLAEAAALPNSEALVICLDERPVGLLVLLHDGLSVEIHRFMVDGRFQELGVGTIALTRLLSRFSAEHPNRKVGIKFLKWNQAAERLYHRLGFEDTGRYDGEEKILELNWNTFCEMKMRCSCVKSSR